MSPVSPLTQGLAGRWLGAAFLVGIGLHPAETAFATAPEELATDPEWEIWMRPWARAAEGNFRPKDRNGDLEDGLFSARMGLDAGARSGLAIAALRGRAGFNVFDSDHPVDLAAETWKIGLENESFHLRFGQIPRWIGPGRHGSLIFAHRAQPPPGGDLGGRIQLPGALGEITPLVAMGWLGGPREDVDSPGWLLMDLRWNHPLVSIGWSRSSLFGGYEDGVARPINVAQLLLPTQPHVEEDPLQLLADTDEIAAWDIRLRAPIGDWFSLPIDYIEAIIQHGGEDIIARKLGPLPYPTLAGVANLYGVTLVAKQLELDAELAVLEDDLFRWYTGHRIYHDGWTHGGVPIGHPWGGDQRNLVVSAAWREPEAWSVSLAYESVRRVEVADRSGSTVWILPGVEQRRYVHGVGELWLSSGARLQLDLTVGAINNPDYSLGAHDIAHRVAFSYWAPLRIWSGLKKNPTEPKDR